MLYVCIHICVYAYMCVCMSECVYQSAKKEHSLHRSFLLNTGEDLCGPACEAKLLPQQVILQILHKING